MAACAIISTVPTPEIFAERFAAQGLSGPPVRDPAAVAERLLAVQGQDPRGARLAVRARSEGLTAADVDRALSDDRSLLITWLNRGTLHLVRSEDYPLLQALTTPPLLTLPTRRLAQEGLSPDDTERAVKALEKALAAEGPLTREQLRERLDAAGVQTAGQALIHLFFLASVRGIVVRGPMVGKQHAYVLVRDWLDPLKPTSTATSPWPSWPAATWSATPRPTIATSPAGRVCRCATRAPAWGRSHRSWSSATTASFISPSIHPAPEVPEPKLLGALRPRPARLDLARADPRPRTTTWSPSTASSAPSPWSKAALSPPGGSNGGKVSIEPLEPIAKKAAAALDADAAMSSVHGEQLIRMRDDRLNVRLKGD